MSDASAVYAQYGIKAPGTFVSWDSVLRNFRIRYRGTDPMLLPPGSWLNLAAEESRQGRLENANIYFLAGTVRESYDRNCYEPPAELQAAFSSPVSAEADR